jgi:hypothetical protein
VGAGRFAGQAIVTFLLVGSYFNLTESDRENRLATIR